MKHTHPLPKMPTGRHCLLDFSPKPERIDFILVWEEIGSKKEDKGKRKNKKAKRKEYAHRIWRWKFLEQLQATGIHMEQHIVKSRKRSIHYVLLGAPWTVLCHHAEILRIKMPLQAMPSQASNWSDNLMRKLGIWNPLYQEVPQTPQDYYTYPFQESELSRFLGSENPQTFFASTQRHKIVYEILEKTPFGHQRRGLFGIQQLLSQKVFHAAFPPHDGPYQIPAKGLAPHELNQRQILFRYWAKWSKWRKYQPMYHIRRYFGEKIAFYFAWLGFYTAWLLPASVFGIVVFLSTFFGSSADVPTDEICNASLDYEMCPSCEDCPFWKLSTICEAVKTGQLFDNKGTVIFSVFMSLWAVMFLENWKRKSARLAYQWDCLDSKEQPLPPFAVMAPLTSWDLITDQEEPDTPQKNDFLHIFVAASIVAAMAAVVTLLLIAIILYRAGIAILVSKSSNIFFLTWGAQIANFTSALLNLSFILLLIKIYIPIAYVLTSWEMHKTQSKFEDALVWKVFVFHFVNIYSVPIYIAFFKGRFSGYPGHYGTFFGMQNENCINNSCLIELAQEMLVIMVGKQIFNTLLEIFIPKLQSWKHKHKLRSSRKRKKEKTSEILWEANYELLESQGLFQEYLEMVIQFGFITIFVASCPLAPLFALLNNWLEIRTDAQKFVCQYRRPMAEKAQNIGMWFFLLQFITHLAIISNAFLIAFTSNFLQRTYYKYAYAWDLHGYTNFTLAQAPGAFVAKYNHTCRYQAFREDDGQHSFTFWKLLAIRLAFIVVFEHVIFFVAWLIDLVVPDIPASVKIEEKQEHFVAKHTLADYKVLP
ncbi:anoctamin-7 isoform X1 [Monodelphis domestica]|uniref:anoctamin-7 isoform X1 n=2 Tax=Monodelphis domestica TaxID=13616 RepID=UPI0024E1A4C4|nr:anoctamin-7 isoform X1 [Monodelphis domestica]XP_056664594.1 anoctamin-7 isoform X1 [Monodelphis domestica]